MLNLIRPSKGVKCNKNKTRFSIHQYIPWNWHNLIWQAVDIDKVLCTMYIHNTQTLYLFLILAMKNSAAPISFTSISPNPCLPSPIVEHMKGTKTIILINPFLTRLVHPYHLDGILWGNRFLENIFTCTLSFFFAFKFLLANNTDPIQLLLFVVSKLGLYCLHLFLK